MRRTKIKESVTAGKGEIVLYRTTDGHTALDVRLEGETLWLSLNQIAELFERDKSVISRHLRNIFITRELERESVVAFFATTAAALFLWFMGKNGALYRRDASKRIADNALVAITLMIAESRPAEKNIMVKLIVNLINSRN